MKYAEQYRMGFEAADGAKCPYHSNAAAKRAAWFAGYNDARAD